MTSEEGKLFECGGLYWVVYVYVCMYEETTLCCVSDATSVFQIPQASTGSFKIRKFCYPVMPAISTDSVDTSGKLGNTAPLLRKSVS
jgi:hypothetical protein